MKFTKENKMTNSNSDAYFKELAAWKAEYKALSQEIRDWKVKRKSLHPSYDSRAAGKKRSCSWKAYIMMEKREVLKDRARAHWAAQTAMFEAEVA